MRLKVSHNGHFVFKSVDFTGEPDILPVEREIDMTQYNDKFISEVQELEAEIQALEKQLDVSEDELNRVVYRVNSIIDEEIEMVDMV